MKLNLELQIKDHEGENMKRYDPPVKEGGEPVLKGDLLLSHVLFASVNSMFKGEELSPEETYARGRLARKVKDKGEKNFTTAEVQTLLKCVAKRYSPDPLFVLMISETLDPEQFKETK